MFAIAFLGSTPIGAPLMGAISDASSPRVALAVGAVATLAASAPLAWRWRRPQPSATTALSAAPDDVRPAVELTPGPLTDEVPRVDARGSEQVVGAGGPAPT